MAVGEGAVLELASEPEASLQGGDLRLPPESVAIVTRTGDPVSDGVPAC
jgi:hypothetical protein